MITVFASYLLLTYQRFVLLKDRPAQSQNVTNLSPMQRPNAAYRSTSDFFKEMMTPVDPLSIKRTNSATNISRCYAEAKQKLFQMHCKTLGSKKVEDYQEEQARLKRSVTALAHDNAVLRSHLQKAEREAAKKVCKYDVGKLL